MGILGQKGFGLMISNFIRSMIFDFSFLPLLSNNKNHSELINLSKLNHFQQQVLGSIVVFTPWQIAQVT
jgi:hypothetical protein